MRAHLWIDGAPRAGAAEPPPFRGPACYTTGRFLGGRVLHGPRVSARLVRDAAALGLGSLDAGEVEEALCALGQACFGAQEGVVRLRASAGATGSTGPELVGTARLVGPEPEAWQVMTAEEPHPGPAAAPGVKAEGREALLRARAALEGTGLHEALLFDADGILVEGSGSNLLVVDAEGRLLTPALARGPVAGVGLEVLRARVSEIEEAELDRTACRGAREILAVNAVRGPRPITQWDGTMVGDGAPGPVCRRLQEVWWKD